MTKTKALVPSGAKQAAEKPHLARLCERARLVDLGFNPDESCRQSQQNELGFSPCKCNIPHLCLHFGLSGNLNNIRHLRRPTLLSRVCNSFKKCCHPERSEGPAFQQFTPPAHTAKYDANFRLRTLARVETKVFATKAILHPSVPAMIVIDVSFKLY